jgi:hypothetical protein
MAYQNIGNSKYENYGLGNPLPGLKTTEDAAKQAWVETLHVLGCENTAFGLSGMEENNP